jgi:hypothetical protein
MQPLFYLLLGSFVHFCSDEIPDPVLRSLPGPFSPLGVNDEAAGSTSGTLFQLLTLRTGGNAFARGTQFDAVAAFCAFFYEFRR